MCRLFAVRADRPVRVERPLVSAPHALRKQSCCDLRGECHDSGWGVGHFAGGRPVVVRSPHPARSDPRYAETAAAVESPTVIGHVRQASVGSVSERNNHPFAHGRWLFAHNGTVEGLAANPDPLRRMVPDRLRGFIQGETDSEQLFYALLSRLGDRTDPEAVAAAVGGLLREVAGHYPGTAKDPTRLNVVLTDGAVMAATWWGHTLHRLDRRGRGAVDAADGGEDLHAVAVASEPVTPDGWAELPDRSLLLVRPDLGWEVIPLA